MKISVKILISLLLIAIICAISVLVMTVSIRISLDTLGDSASSASAAYDEVAVLLGRALLIAYVFLGVTFGAVVAVWLLLSKNLTKPLNFFASELSVIAETGNIFLGDAAYKKTKVLNKRGDEVGEISRSIGDVLAMLRNKIKSLKAISGGDMTVQVELRTPEDTIGSELVGMVNSLNDMFVDIRLATRQAAIESKQTADGAQSLAHGSTEQAATVQRLSSSVVEIAKRTKDNAAMAERAANLADAIMQNAEKGNRQMDEMTKAVEEINQASQSIGKIIKVIDDIAFQTNILALNAAVEAARAGQHGKGFAVVAEEVRNLAAKSADAAKDTGRLIADTMEKAQFGSRIAEETAASLNEIVSGINESNSVVSSIAESSEEQSIGIEQINENIDHVAQVVRQNSETAQSSAKASEEMSRQSTILEELISQFKLNG